MNSRDLLMEFIQWCVDHPGESRDMFEDPDVAVDAVEAFLETVGETP